MDQPRSDSYAKKQRINETATAHEARMDPSSSTLGMPETAPSVRLTQPRQCFESRPEPQSKYTYAMVCSSNINRSMEAHVVLMNEDFKVNSYGCGSKVRLPGPGGARVFDFGTPYQTIVETMQKENADFYSRKGVLDLARRAASTKTAPERWQDIPSDKLSSFDVIVCFEARLFDVVCEDLQHRPLRDFRPLHVLCMDTKDTTTDAVQQGKDVLDLCRNMEAADLATEVPDLVLENSTDGKTQYTLVYV